LLREKLRYSTIRANFDCGLFFLTNPSIKGSQENNRRQIEKQKNRKSAAKTKMKWFFRFRTLAL